MRYGNVVAYATIIYGKSISSEQSIMLYVIIFKHSNIKDMNEIRSVNF